ncbi:2-iminobutanoate/2-iminopropanoate deaminase-like [Branchiostoma floridae]|uniref:2-iminobutanoate/2-iminopropanoate deaminase-like n=1 Tax=Branchiostoma floridae TaxID=7739 RepID=A0A9J7LEF5_BRAFL|nr:2-iminobutanoate/2-iminopropanoate deaminase-like [Branchiostoma floridae]
MAGVVRKIIAGRNPAIPLSQAVIVGDTMYISGQLGLDPSTPGKFVPGGVVPEAEQALKNMGSILKAANIDYSHVVKATVLLADINDFAAVNEVYKKYFPANPPARAAFQVAALPLGGRVEIEAIAIVSAIVDRPASKL